MSRSRRTSSQAVGLIESYSPGVVLSAPTPRLSGATIWRMFWLAASQTWGLQSLR